MYPASGNGHTYLPSRISKVTCVFGIPATTIHIYPSYLRGNKCVWRPAATTHILQQPKITRPTRYCPLWHRPQVTALTVLSSKGALWRKGALHPYKACQLPTSIRCGISHIHCICHVPDMDLHFKKVVCVFGPRLRVHNHIILSCIKHELSRS